MYYIGNSIIKGKEIAPLSDQRFTGIDGELYELFKVENGKPLFLAEHLERFASSIVGSGKELPEGYDKLPQLIDWLILVNAQKTCNVRLCLSSDGLFQGGFVSSEYPTAQMYQEGVKCMIMKAMRKRPGVKMYHADMREEAQEQQRVCGVYESVLVDTANRVTEGSRSNMFFVKDDVIYTAPDDKVLGGIVRKKLIELCQRNNVSVEFVSVKVDELSKYEAAFMTSTPARILPISGIAMGRDVLYDVNNVLMRRVMELMEREVEGVK